MSSGLEMDCAYSPAPEAHTQSHATVIWQPVKHSLKQVLVSTSRDGGVGESADGDSLPSLGLK